MFMYQTFTQMLATTIAGNEMSKESHIVGGSLVGLNNETVAVATAADTEEVELVDLIDMAPEEHSDIETVQFMIAPNPGETMQITIDVASVALVENKKERMTTMRMTSAAGQVLEIKKNATNIPSEKTAAYYDTSGKCTQTKPCDIYEAEEDVPKSMYVGHGNHTGVNGRRRLSHGRRLGLWRKWTRAFRKNRKKSNANTQAVGPTVANGQPRPSRGPGRQKCEREYWEHVRPRNVIIIPQYITRFVH
jgi:hypothetical protein